MSALQKLIRKRIEELGYKRLKQCARARGVPYELLRKVVSDGHIPKDSTLTLYAERLGMSEEVLYQAAYSERMPRRVRDAFARVEGVSEGSPGGAGGVLASLGSWAPVLGVAACGPWIEGHEVEAEQHQPIDPPERGAFFVIAEGESMIGGNVLPRALLLVRPEQRVENGHMVLVRLDVDQFTVKRYHREPRGSTVLQPMNPAFDPILVPAERTLEVMRIAEIRIRC